jgi:flagellar biosynthetic protein FlhB
VGPVVLGLMILGTLANAAQVGFHFYWEILTPKFHKFNPISGIQRLLFSKHSAVEVAKNVFKIAIIGMVAYIAVKAMIEDAVGLMDGDAATVVGFMTKSAASAATKMGLAFLVVAGLDYAFQRYEHEETLKMTKPEVKEEGKMAEGDPLIKGRIRSIQRQIAYKRMMTEVPKADVVVTNPTHVAVALKYDAAKMNAPKVIAKGAELIAKRIKDIALQHNIPIVEDRMLARTLYRTVDAGHEVPEKLFQAVAQVLAYIYRMKNAAKAAW